MDSYDAVRDLHAWRTDWNIDIKVLRRWFIVHRNGNPGLAFVFVDEHGSKIYGTCGATCYEYFERVCPKGEWVRLTDFRLIRSDWKRKERVTKHKSQITLNSETKDSRIRPLSEDPFMNFVDFDEIYNRPYNHLYPVNLIGVLVNVGELLTSESSDGSAEKSLKFTIKNLEDQTVNCLAHGDFAVDIKNQTVGVDGPVAICVLTDWVVNKCQDEITIHDHENIGFSRFFVTPPIDEVLIYRKKIWERIKKTMEDAGNHGM
ncbi:uncharacterized protein LOC112083093 [Eutrema salsugineum]|uniref:uncharacterized protein LOC112083093 n=1 Tax=Eutrema salsugineum TaxID=72664 RepID=UPI000CED0983|nr:uncharacterized protein LOC112083093 [Eutrema salsugineum]